MRFNLMAATVAVVLSASPLYGASKLKGFYSGSGGISQEVHRVLLVEFGEDGSVVLQQTWTDKDPQVWHARWTQDKDKVSIVFEPIKDQPAIEPLICNLKHDVLVPVSWDAKALGVLGPPKLAPFGGKNIKQHSVLTCQSLNTANPAQHCVTWDSRTK